MFFCIILFYMFVYSIKSNKKLLKMTITNIAKLAIRGKRGTISKIAEALGVSDQAVYRMMRTDSDDLTKAAAVRVIREETGLGDDQILEEIKESISQN